MQSHPLLRHLLVLAALTGPASAAGASSQERPAGHGEASSLDPVDAARRLVEDWTRGGGHDARQLLEWTARVGAQGIRALFAELDEREDERRTLSTVGAMRRALEGVPALASDSVRGVGSDPAAESYRAAALWILHDLGRYNDLGRVFELSTTPGNEPASDKTLEALEGALDGIFGRFPAHVGRVRDFLPTIDAAQKARLIRALGRHPSSRSFALLGEMLDDEPHFHNMILAQMGKIANDARPASEVRSIVRVRELLTSSDPRVRREAALTLGKIEDVGSFPALIELLSDSDQRLSANAHWALMRISGRNFRAEARRWAAWHDAEVEWWQTRAQVLLQTVESGGSEVSTALNELTTHRLFRHEIAKALQHLLEHRRNDIVLLACAALYSLRSTVALPELVGLLEHQDPRIRESAHRALRRTTGHDFPPDPAAWEQVLIHAR